MSLLFTTMKKWNIEWSQACPTDYATAQCRELNTRMQAERLPAGARAISKNQFTTYNNRSPLAERILAEFSLHVIAIFPPTAWRKRSFSIRLGIRRRRSLRSMREKDEVLRIKGLSRATLL